jgi:hypothetical protein
MIALGVDMKLEWNIEILNEKSQWKLWNIQWKCTSLIMKEAMNTYNLANEIFIEMHNESTQNW